MSKYEVVFLKNDKRIGSIISNKSRDYSAEFLLGAGLIEFGKKFQNLSQHTRNEVSPEDLFNNSIKINRL